MVLSEQLERIDLELDAVALKALERLADELLRWNQRRNLTSITERGEVLEKHLLDSLTLLPYVRSVRRLLDIGSGAGFPGLPLKIACPTLEVVTVDSVGKKVEFQRHVARTLGLQGFQAVHARAELLADQPGYRASFDLVTARAFSSLADFVALAAPFLAEGGSLLAMKGPDGEAEVAASQPVFERDGWLVTVRRLTLPASGAGRCLVLLSRQP